LATVWLISERDFDGAHILVVGLLEALEGYELDYGASLVRNDAGPLNFKRGSRGSPSFGLKPYRDAGSCWCNICPFHAKKISAE
jgi:hypothetical protein